MHGLVHIAVAGTHHLRKANADQSDQQAGIVFVRHEIFPGLRDGLDGKFVAPGPSGAPSRGRPDVLPTGRNFYSVDTRAIPTATAWQLGFKSANLLIERYLQEHGDYPRAIGLSVWGTATKWPDLIVAGFMASLFLYSSWQIVTQAMRELRAVICTLGAGCLVS